MKRMNIAKKNEKVKPLHGNMLHEKGAGV